MSRIWSSGFELNSVTTDIEASTVTGTFSMSTTTVRSGTYALRTQVSGQKAYQVDFISPSNDGPFFCRVYLNIATLPDVNNTIIALNNTAALTSLLVQIILNTDGTLTLADEDGTIGSPSSALSTGTWYRIEFEVDRTPASGSEIVRARINGSEFAGSATRSLSAAFFNIAFGCNINGESATTGDWFFDDAAINDATDPGGGQQMSYPGDGKIVHARPNAEGDNATGSRGGADSGTNYGQVDEVTPNDATDYYILATTSEILDVNVEDSSTIGISSGDAITVIQVGFRAAGADATAHNPGGPRIKSASGGTVQVGSPSLRSDASFYTIASTRAYRLTSYTDPTTGIAWTPTGTNSIDNMQIGVQPTDATPDVYYSTLWAVIEYVPAGAGGDLSVSESENITVTAVPRSYSDTIIYRENVVVAIVAGGGELTVNVSDSITVSESTKVELSSFISVSESITVSESLQRELNSFIVVSDSITVSEAVKVERQSHISVVENVTVSESIKLEVNSFINKSENITVTESVQMSGVPNPSVSDTITVTESSTVIIEGQGAYTSDNVTVTESISIIVSAPNTLISDSISVSESLRVELNSFINKSESITVTESVKAERESNINKSESITVTESVNRLLTSNINVTQAITVTEAITLLIPVLFLIISESITVSESYTVFTQQDLNISVSDSIVVTDQVTMTNQFASSQFVGIVITTDKPDDITVQGQSDGIIIDQDGLNEDGIIQNEVT